MQTHYNNFKKYRHNPNRKNIQYYLKAKLQLRNYINKRSHVNYITQLYKLSNKIFPDKVLQNKAHEHINKIKKFIKLVKYNDTINYKKISMINYYGENKCFNKKFSPNEIEKKTLNSYFMPNELYCELGKNIKKLQGYRYKNIDVYVPITKNELYKINNLSEIFKRILIVDNLRKKHNIAQYKKYMIFLLPSLKLKSFKDIKVFTPKNVNSGDTSPYSNGRVFIYRREELLKVLIHEMIHYMNIDKRFKNNFNYDLSKIFSYQKKTDVEIFVESLACIINVILAGGNIVENWRIELLFSLYQTGKILFISGFKSFEKFKERENIVKQTTNACEYHILKSLVIFNLDKFINEIYFNQDYDKMVNIIIESSRDIEYINIVNTFINNMDTSSLLYETGRMTIIE